MRYAAPGNVQRHLPDQFGTVRDNDLLRSGHMTLGNPSGHDDRFTAAGWQNGKNVPRAMIAVMIDIRV